VKTIVENLNATKGSNSVTWIGDTNQKYFAPVGTYYGIVQTQNHRFETTVQVFHF
jgi:flagellar hook assembly protein FlgD